MARSSSRTSRTSRTYRRRERFVWPLPQVIFWTIFILAAAATLMGVFGEFIQIQNRMDLGVPWLFPYGVTVGAITVFFVFLMFIQLAQGQLQPAMMVVFAFILLALYITGLVDTGILLFGDGNVSNNCNSYVNNAPQYGATVETLAWLQQNNICSCWYAAFAFWLLGSIFFLWMLIMAAQVGSGAFDP